MKLQNNQIAFIAAVALLLLPLATKAQVWENPTQTPPGTNVAAPLNVSSTGQSKAGGLLLNTGGAANGLIVQFGNMGLGTTSPSAKFAITALGSGTGRAFALANSSNVEKVTILDNGNVGLGKTPAYPLDVFGDANATRLCINGVCQSSWSSGGQWTLSGTNISYTGGNVSVGTTNTNALLTVNGGLQVGVDSNTCTAAKAGTLRWYSNLIQVCNGSSWQAVNPSQSAPGTEAGTCNYTIGNVGYNPDVYCQDQEGPAYCNGGQYGYYFGYDKVCGCVKGWTPKKLATNQYTCVKGTPTVTGTCAFGTPPICNGTATADANGNVICAAPSSYYQTRSVQGYIGSNWISYAVDCATF